MSMNDPLANALSHLLNSEKNAKSEAYLSPASKMLKCVLEIMNTEGYIGNYVEIDDGKGKTVKVNLLGKINRCGVIKPRYSLQKAELEKYEKRYLPARGFGLLIISTTKGIITHDEAKKKGLGGRLVAYCY